MDPVLVPPGGQLHPNERFERNEPEITGVFTLLNLRIRLSLIRARSFGGKDNVDGIALFAFCAIEKYFCNALTSKNGRSLRGFLPTIDST